MDVAATIKVTGEAEERNGETYMTIRKFDLKPTLGDLKTHVEGLFPDPGLTQIAVDLINNNWRAMFDVMIDEAKTMWEPFLLENANSFFSVVPLRKMFL